MFNILNLKTVKLILASFLVLLVTGCASNNYAGVQKQGGDQYSACRSPVPQKSFLQKNAKAITGGAIAGIGSFLISKNPAKGDSSANNLAALAGAFTGGVIGHSFDQSISDMNYVMAAYEVNVINQPFGFSVVFNNTARNNIEFANSSHIITGTCNEVMLADIGKMIAQNDKHIGVRIKGFTSKDGWSGNQGLSVNRANSVANKILAAGAPASNVHASGHGESTTYPTKGQNRRIELEFYKIGS